MLTGSYPVCDPGKKMLKLCLLLCLIVCIDCRLLGRNVQRRYGGPNPNLHPPTTSLHAPRPGSYAHKWPLNGGPRYHYPSRPQIINYQQQHGHRTPMQKAKILNIMLDHSGHVDTDSLFPAAHQIPTVFIPSNAPALAPPMVVGYGLYDKKHSAPPHAHFSMLHPSYESSYTQHHHNEISYFDNPPPQNYKYPMPYPMKNYVASSSYSSVAHQGQSNINNQPHPPPPFQMHQQQQPQQQQQQQHQQHQHEQPAAYPSHYPETHSPPLPSPTHLVPMQSPYQPNQPYQPNSIPNEVGYLHQSPSNYLPAHFSHNNPLGILPCCEDVPWTPVETAPPATTVPLVREQRLYPTTRHPMMSYLPIKGHHVESESRPYLTIVAVSNVTSTSNSTSTGLKANDTATSASAIASNQTQNVAKESEKPAKNESPKNITMSQIKLPLLMLSPQNSSSSSSSSSSSASLSTPIPTRSSLPKLKNSTSMLGAFLASITEDPGIAAAFDVKPTNLSQADIGQDAIATTPSPVTPKATTPLPPTTRSPPIRAPPVQSDDIFGIPGDILPSDGGAAADSAGEGGGNGMVDIFTSFLDELANIIEQFSPTDLPGAANEAAGAASDAVGEAAGEAAGTAGEAGGEAGGLAGDIGGAGGTLGDLGGAGLGGLPDIPGSVAGGIGDGLGGVGEGLSGVGDGLSGVAQGVGGGADGFAGGVGGGAEGVAGGASIAGNDISASGSQISANTLRQQAQQQPAFVFEGISFGPQFGPNFNDNFEMGESAEAEGEFFGDALESVSHAESEPVAEASMGIQDHFIEIPISELVPHPSFIRNNFMVNPFSEAEPHPVVTNLGRPKDFEVDHFDSQESEDEDQIASATESNYQVHHQPLDSDNENEQNFHNNDQKPSRYNKERDSYSTPQPVSNDIELTTTTAAPKLRVNKNNAIPWPKVTPEGNRLLESLLAKSPDQTVTLSPEIISFSSTVSHWPQYGARVSKGERSNDRKDQEQQRKTTDISVEVVPSNAVGQDKNGREEDTKAPPTLAKATPKTDITIKSELGAIRNTHKPERGLNHVGRTEKSIQLAEISTIRDYHSRNTNEDEESANVPDAEGIPANILPEVQSNINLDLLRTDYSEMRAE